MSPQDAWANKNFADQWDGRNHFRDNPDRGEQLDLLVTLLADECQEGSRIIDLGSGSGRVEELIFDRIPGAQVVGIDSSPSMMDLAKARLAPYGERFIPIIGGMSELDTLELPIGPYSFVISIQALHEIPHSEKRKVMETIYDRLAPGGTFYLMDRVEFDGQALSASYQSVWNRLNRKASLEEPMSYAKYWSTYRSKDDHVATLEEQLSWLRAAGFHAACLYLHYNRALFVAKRPETTSSSSSN